MSLEGGGVKGIAYGGVAMALEQIAFLDHIEGFSGSSAGSQAAALLAAGYTGRELMEELVSMDFNSLLDSATTSNSNNNMFSVTNPLDDLKGLIEKFGWFKGEVLEREIDRLIEKKTGLKGTTFKQLLEFNGKRLRVTATCVTTQRLLWLDAESYPDMPISKAVHASSAIPFFFQPVSYDGLLLVDGGCIRNLPHDAFQGNAGSMLALSLRHGGADLKALENR